ncbi:hypothetical protein [Flavisolibacter nicotianae]|uniref:hypothetical protein n=1 Tax=Flavisolibacter nicotianae TaxID=2364882 RepID=UPI000EB4598C|nr:hypothetical protein [Flavisolibacter nicotianae]
MKKLSYIFSFFLLCTIAVRAQQITATSTAEDCVNFINQMAQTGNASAKKHDFIRSASFTGGTFVETQDWKYSINKETFSNINWADFEKVSIIKPKAVDEDIMVFFSFKTNQVTRESFGIDKETNLVKDRENEIGKDLYFNISSSEEGKIKDLEIAANRLKQIVIAKGNLFKTAVITSSKIKNIEGKPSFQETTNYINAFLKDGKSNDLFCNLVKYKSRSATVGEHINGHVYLISSYVWDVNKSYSTSSEAKSYKIDLSNVEEIKIVTGEGFRGGCLQVGLWFVEKGKSATPVMHLPLWNTAFDSFNASQYKEEKIYKAFEHLRKLCGAPDPISF